MEVSLNMFKTILKTVPISYYTGRNIDTEISTTADTSYYEPLIDKITISYKGMESMFEKMKSSDDLEECIRSVLYHEISHALITPKGLMNTRDETDAYLFNVFEDERIETVFKDYYYGVNFKKNIVLMNNYEGQKPTNAFEAFYYTVRFRSGKREHLNIVDNIIEKYYDMDNEERGSYTVSYYQNDIKDLFNKICKDWYENNDKKTLDEFDPKYDSKSQSGKEQSAGDCARKQNKESGGTMGDDTITTIILVDDDFDENGHNHNPKKEGKGGGNTVIMKPGSGEPGKGDSNMPSPTSNKEGDDKENKKKELEKLLEKIDKNCRIIDQRKNKSQKQKLLDSTLNKYIDNSLTDNIATIFQNFEKKNNRTKYAGRGYFGVINPYDVGRKDWRIFTYKDDNGYVNGFDKLHLNLFIDTSGSFSNNVVKVNTILKSLDALERRFPFFEYDLVSCQVGEQMHDKSHRFIKAYGGNDLDDEIHPIYRKLQKAHCFNCNVILFDGDAFTDCRGRGHEKNFSAFNNTNCYIISDSDNQRYIEKYAPKSYKVFVKGGWSSRVNYSQLLYENILKVLRRALG